MTVVKLMCLSLQVSEEAEAEAFFFLFPLEI